MEVTDGLDSLVVKVKPHRDLGYSWEIVDKIIREFGGEWFKDSTSAKDDDIYLARGYGVWRIPKKALGSCL